MSDPDLTRDELTEIHTFLNEYHDILQSHATIFAGKMQEEFESKTKRIQGLADKIEKLCYPAE